MEANLPEFELLSTRCKSLKSQLEDLTQEKDNELFVIKRALGSGTWSTQDDFLDLCIYEFKEDFRNQHEKLRNLKELLQKNIGQYVQINTAHKELRGGANYKQSVIGILDNIPLSVKKNKEEHLYLDFPIYSLDFNFKGEHIFYESHRLLYSGRNILYGSSGPKLKLIKGSQNLSASEFKEIEFSSDLKLESENRIYAGNHLLPEMVSFFGIKDIKGIPYVNDLYDLLKENVEGLEVAEKNEKHIIKLRKSMGLKRF